MKNKLFLFITLSALITVSSCQEPPLTWSEVKQVFTNIKNDIGSPEFKYPIKLESEVNVDGVNYKSRISLEDLYSYSFREGYINEQPCTIKHWNFVVENETLYQVDLVDFVHKDFKDIRVYAKYPYENNKVFVDIYNKHKEFINNILYSGRDIVLSYDYPIIQQDDALTKVSINTNKRHSLEFKVKERQNEDYELVTSLLIQNCFPKSGIYHNNASAFNSRDIYFHFAYNFCNTQKPNIIDFEEVESLPEIANF